MDGSSGGGCGRSGGLSREQWWLIDGVLVAHHRQGWRPEIPCAQRAAAARNPSPVSDYGVTGYVSRLAQRAADARNPRPWLAAGQFVARLACLVCPILTVAQDACLQHLTVPLPAAQQGLCGVQHVRVPAARQGLCGVRAGESACSTAGFMWRACR